MRVEPLALYQKSLLGGLGGLLGWGLMSTFVNISGESIVKDTLTGAMVGVGLGACLGLWEGLFRARSVRKAVIGFLVGALAGGGAGAVGMMCGGLLFMVAGGGLIARSVGWAIFGALVGMCESLPSLEFSKALLSLRSIFAGLIGLNGAKIRHGMQLLPQKFWFGIYGGLLGGLIGGSTYQSMAAFLQLIGLGRQFGVAVAGAVGLVILGMCIGLMVGLVENLLRTAWLIFTSGRLEGQSRTLDPNKQAIRIGRSDLAEICLLGDPAVVNDHARVVVHDGIFTIEAVDGSVEIGAAQGFRAVTSHMLRSGDLIQVGSSRAKFQTSSSSS